MSRSYLTARVNEITSVRIEDSYMCEVLDEFRVGDNARMILEQRAIENAESFLDAFSALKVAADEADFAVETILREAERLTEMAESALGAIDGVLRETEAVQKEKEEKEKCMAVVDVFSTRFQLSIEEKSVLLKGKLDDPFLTAFAHAKAVLVDVNDLLVGSEHFDGLGKEIAAEMNGLIKNASQKICDWMHTATTQLFTRRNADYELFEDDQENALLDSMLTKCFAALKGCDSYQVTVDDLIARRENVVTQSFMNALTVGKARFSIPPIEIHASDPLRYVSDMLAWVHQALANEYELINSLLGGSDVTEEGRTHDSVDVISALVKIFEGICRPLKVRIDQVVNLCKEPVVLFKVLSVISFYLRVISEILTESSPLSLLLKECVETTLSNFHVQVVVPLDRIRTGRMVIPSDLSTTSLVKDITDLESELVLSLGSSLCSPDDTRKQLVPALDMLLRPLPDILVDACSSRLDRASLCVFIINSLVSVLTPLCSSVMDEEPLDACLADIVLFLTESINSYVNVISTEQSNHFLLDCGILQKISFIQQRTREGETHEKLAETDTMSVKAIEGVSRAFERCLLDLGSSLLQPRIERTLNPKYRSRVQQLVAQRVLECYSEVYFLVTDAESGYPESGAGLFRYHPNQVKVMLDI